LDIFQEVLHLKKQLTGEASGRGGACAIFRVGSRCSFSLWHWRATLGWCASFRRLMETIRFQKAEWPGMSWRQDKRLIRWVTYTVAYGWLNAWGWLSN